MLRPADHETDAYLQMLGGRLRHLRAQRGMTRRVLADRSGVSERHIAQFEGGSGNISILLLRRLALALGSDTGTLAEQRAERPIELVLLEQTLSRLPPEKFSAARALLLEHFGQAAPHLRSSRIALVGLRGAGKSTLGRKLAALRDIRFVELDREIEREARMELREIFELHGQAGFRRLERSTLHALIDENLPMVIATGGSLVTEASTYEVLLANFTTIWLRASPEEHMRRVVDQGDLRPMQDNRTAMTDLRAILESRQSLYARADAVLDTDGKSVAEALRQMAALLF